MNTVRQAGTDSDPTTISTTRTSFVRICHYCPERPYVELHIPANIKHVRRVVFTTTSCDQGYSGESSNNEALRGTYEHSFSWFEAGIATTSSRDRFPRRKLLNNAHAISEPREHKIEWDFEKGDEALRQWMYSIQPGDRVQLIPKARHRGWHNNVFRAHITVFGNDQEHASEVWRPAFAPTSVYHRLETTKTIRLIALHPGTSEEKLSCTLKHAELDRESRDSYECLSYCWGDRRDARTLHISYGFEEDGRNLTATIIPVTSNLHNALLNLRHHSEPRTMWIDALCINQADPNECSRQVSMMREIYFQAKKVIVWLGSQGREFDTCLADADMVKMRYEDAKQTKVSDTTKLHKPLLDSGSYHVDTPLFRNDYFRRAWVLQEVHNAKEVSVLYGNKMIPWHLILRLNECIARSTVYSNPVAKNAMPPLFAELFSPDENTDKFPAYSASYSAQAVRNGILDVILEGLDLETTDPRDKIFALLSFGEETSDFTCHPLEIRPDYTKTSAQVFADFTKWWIQTHQSLRILSAVHTSRDRTWMKLDTDESQAPAEDRPTWSLWHTGKSIWAQGTLALNPSSAYYTSGNTTPTFGTLEDSTALSLLGRRISTIAQISRYPYYHTYFGHRENHNHAQPCSQQAMYDAYVHLSDPLAWRGTWTSRLQRSDMQELRQPYDRKLTYDKNFDHFLAHARPSAERPDRVDLKDNPSVGCHGPCWFRTPDGVEGLHPPMAKVGDLIVVLYGGKVPYVLRPQEGKGDEITKYSFIGECYLEGYMHGRALDLQDGDKECPEQFFNLI